MYEVEFDLQISNLRQEAYLSAEKVGRVQVSRVVILDGIHKLLVNESTRDCLHLDVDFSSSLYIGPGNSFFVPNPDLYQPLQDVVLRRYQDGRWQGYYYVTPIFVPDLQWDLVLGSNHFSRLGVEWDSEMKQLVPLTLERPVFHRVTFPSRHEMVPTRDLLRRFL